MADPHGVLIVDKPSGPTSFAVVAAARRLYSTRRVGHCGTLDPMASGVLVLVLGEATKLANVLTFDDKAYRAEISFGAATDTLDAQGQVLSECQVCSAWLSSERLEQALCAERARTSQLPPQFSAIRLDGRRAYDLARKGQHAELPPRAVNVKRLEVVDYDDHRLTVELLVSKGYYVRSLARDLCEHLGMCGHLSALRRLSSGCFELQQAVSWPREQPTQLLSVSDAVRQAMPCATLDVCGTIAARRGQRLSAEHFLQPPQHEHMHAWLDPEGELVALGSAEGEQFRVRRGFTTAVAQR